LGPAGGVNEKLTVLHRLSLVRREPEQNHAGMGGGMVGAAG
jgi:hypothetical protein